MQPDERDAANLWDLRKFAIELSMISEGMSAADYTNDPVRRRALERVLGLVGEAARRVSEPFRAAHPEIAWRQIVGLRNLLAHEYERVDDAVVWQIISGSVPPLIEAVTAMLPPLPTDEP
ncbi:MAG: hypothetical protein QOI24_2118 [Acidobacteriota bacterium]|jgi:uncharacterized protein with HEPN domain|nr:hypothetical protein [Acidobacteriota bacterium]